jgi:hypothetical protein
MSSVMPAARGPAAWLHRLAVISGTAALALYAVLQAVDGVALKQAVDAWLAAPEEEKFARFAVAEGMRWAEWATRSYFSFVFACMLVCFGVTIALTAHLLRPAGMLLMAAGLAYLAQGWIIGATGFSDANTLPTLVGIICIVMAGGWILFASLAMKLPDTARAAGAQLDRMD